MPIYDQGYERWKGELQRYPARWWPIVRQGVLQILPQRKYLALLVLAFIGPLLRGVQLLGMLSDRLAAVTDAVQNMFGADFMQVSPRFFWDVIESQGLFVLLFTLMVGSDLIASDRRHRALQIYFSKPITRNDYIAGKLGVVATFLVLSVWLPVMLLWIFGLMVEPTASYFAKVWSVPFALTAYSALLIGVAGLLILAISSVGTRSVVIGGSWFILFGYGPFQAIVALLKELSGNQYWGLISIESNLQQVGAWWFGGRLPHEYHPVLSLVLVGIVIVACYGVLRRRIEPVEVVL